MQNTEQRLLGIDYGSKRIGVSLTDESGSMALPHSVIKNSDGALQEIMGICIQSNVKKIVIGESKDYSGKDNQIMKEMNNFVDALRKQTAIEVIFHPEFLTSFQAERTQYELYGKSDMLDASAATLILQSYIDSNKNK